MEKMKKQKIIQEVQQMIRCGRFEIQTSVTKNSSIQVWDKAHAFAKNVRKKIARLRYRLILSAYSQYYYASSKPDTPQFIKFLLKWVIKSLDENGEMSDIVKLWASFDINYHIGDNYVMIW